MCRLKLGPDRPLPCITRTKFDDKSHCRRVHGLKSGKMLKEFLGHTSYANDAIYSPDGSQIVSAASDGTVRVWETKSCEQLRAFKYALSTCSYSD